MRWAVLLLWAGCLGPVLELPPPRDSTAKGVHGEVPHAVSGKSRRARAFVIESTDQLLAGAAADGQIGDYELENGVVAFVIARENHALGFADSGGHLIDAGPYGGQDALKQIVSGAQRQALYQKLEIDERDGAAVVRALGHDADDKNLNVVTEYLLKPGARELEINTTFHNGGSSALRSFPISDAIQWGQAERFIPEEGFTLEAAAPRELSTREGWLLGVAPKVSYAYVVSGALKAKHGVGWSDVTLAETALLPGAATKVKRWLLVSPTPDVSLGEALATLRGESWPRISGRVVENQNNAPVAGARLIFSNRMGGPIAVAESLAQGNYAQVAPADDYLVSADAVGRSGSQRLEVTLAAGAPTTLDVLMSQPGSLRFHVEEDGRASPAKLSFFGVLPTLTPLFGPASRSPGANVVLTADGNGQVPLAPGRYHIVASRGPAFSIDAQDVEVTAGEPAEAHFRLTRAVELPGLVCADLHQHASPSADSAVSAADRVTSNLAEGLDVEIATDHNTLSADYAAALGGLHASRPLLVAPGDEVTREGVGHFNVWPMPVDSSRPQGGAPDVRGKGARELLAELRAPDRVVAVNHPRSGSIGYFNLSGFKADGPLPQNWEGGFDAIEVFNGKDASKTDEPLADWMSLTNRGLLYTAVGGSDSHLIWGQEVGYPRTCVFLDGPPSLQGLVAAIRQKREALVTNGPFVTVSIGGKGMGQLAPAPRGKVRLDVEVRAAPWVDARKLEIFVNGERRGKPIEIPPSKSALRYQASQELKIDRDSSIVVIVRGETSLEPVVSRPDGAPVPTPLAITNPIFVDRDGDGRFTGPTKIHH